MIFITEFSFAFYPKEIIRTIPASRFV